ncbi:CAP domain-containing protein [Streptomyces sp. NPDC052676]|uniref:CAP domain-containing protein n=1 Tax=Streptomyces sp. NPDC052676 TaxID=3154953 RepID=UPI003420A065
MTGFRLPARPRKAPAGSGRALLVPALLIPALIVPALLAVPSPAGADPYPVPPPPPFYEAPAWPAATPGHWQPPPAPGPQTGGARPPGSGTPSGGSRPAGTAQRLVEAVNRYRADAGCGPVRAHPALNRAARAHSAHMARHRRLSHTGAGASTPAERMRAAGYRARHTAEAITAGPATPEAALSAWMDSAPHRELILSCRYLHAGVGAAAGGGGPWWTLDLATDR